MNLSALGLTNIPYMILGIIGLGFIISFHEFGHYIFCKLFNVHTPTFSVGFGPRILSKKFNGTLFTLSAIPLGGYVEIAGAAEVGQGDQLEAARNDETSFKNKPYWQKLLILLGGIIFNVIFALIAFFFLAWTGIPKTPLIYPFNGTTTIKTIAQDSPAEKAGLQVNDVIIAINNVPMASAPDIIASIEPLADSESIFTITRNAETLTLPVRVGSKEVNNKKIGTVGLGFDMREIKASSFMESLNLSWYLLVHSSKLIGNSLINLFKERQFERVGGPLMIISQTIQGAKQGFGIFILLLAFISINLAIFNLLPFPILDGGQIVTYTIEALFGRSLPESVRYGIHLITWILFIALFLILTLKDANALGAFNFIKTKIINLIF